MPSADFASGKNKSVRKLQCLYEFQRDKNRTPKTTQDNRTKHVNSFSEQKGFKESPGHPSGCGPTNVLQPR
eukprot:1024936-Amphidinium_carterae.1